MELTNNEWVGRILAQLNEGLGPYVLGKYKTRYPIVKDDKEHRDYPFYFTQVLLDGNRTVDVNKLRTDSDWLKIIDIYGWLRLMRVDRSFLFAGELGNLELVYGRELREYRNKWAHQRPISDNEVFFAAYSAERILRLIKADKQADEVGQIFQRLKGNDWRQSNGWRLQSSAIAEDQFSFEDDTLPLTLYPGNYLEVTCKDGEVSRHSISKERLIIGRSLTNSDIHIADKLVSRVHLQVARNQDGNVTITDLHSGNGTFLNKERIRPSTPVTWLSDQVVLIGETELSWCRLTIPHSESAA